MATNLTQIDILNNAGTLLGSFTKASNAELKCSTSRPSAPCIRLQSSDSGSGTKTFDISFLDASGSVKSTLLFVCSGLVTDPFYIYIALLLTSLICFAIKAIKEVTIWQQL